MGAKTIPDLLKEQARSLFLSGASTYTVSQSLGISWSTARRLSIGYQPILCSCGKQINHRGKCKHSLEYKGSSSESNNQTAFQLSTNNFTAVISDGSTGKCVEVACPFPAIYDSKCRRHAIESSMAYSFSSSTLGPADLFFLPDRNRVSRRPGCK